MKSFAAPVALLCAACGGATPEAAAPRPLPQVEPAAAPPPPLVAPAPPKLRLSGDVEPRHYRLVLRVVPGGEGFDGEVAIDVAIAKPIGGLWLHGRELEVTRASLTPRGGQPVAATPLPRPPGAEGFIGLGLARTVEPGPATLAIEFAGTLQAVETLGLFRQKDGDDWYAFTQFETTDASRAFPCFDDPRWKTPWDLTLRVPRDSLAVANTAQVEESLGEDGLKTVRFATSQPLPTYLVAFAVGPFGVVDAGKTRSGAPVRILTLRGDEAGARYPAEVTARIVGILEDYLGVPYAYDKLDSIAVPKTVGFGAMENPGLITYNRNTLTAPPGRETVRFRQRYAQVAAHEIAHLWFGDYVTLSWWNDAWLNESMANWGGSTAMERFAPEWREAVERVTERSRGINADASPTVRPVRRPVESEDDMSDVFDPSGAYAKGQAILHMVEGWVGPEAFRKGITAYLRAHAHGNAVTADLTRAISEAAGKDVAPVLSAFLEQPGAPRVAMDLSCAAGGAPRIALDQTRHLHAGGEAAAERWPVPVCVRYGSGRESGRACTLLEGEQGVLELPTRACPHWVAPNADGLGYYVSLPRGELAARFSAQARKHLSVAEQTALISDLGQLMRAAVLPAGEVLVTLAALDPSRDAYLASAAIATLSPVGRDLVTAPQRAAYARYIDELFGARARKLGFSVKPGEDDATRELRNDIVPVVAIEGRDRALRARARQLAGRWLADRKSVDADLVGTVLSTAVATCTAKDRALFDRLLAELARNKAPGDRRLLINGLAGVRDPQLVTELLTALAAPGNDLRETWSIRSLYFGGVRESRRAIYQFIDAHFEELAARMARPARGGLMRAGALLCDEAGLASYQEAFARRAAGVLEGRTSFADAVASVRACIALERAQRASLDGYLRRI
jgi:alanyl aminopeptidase